MKQPQPTSEFPSSDSTRKNSTIVPVLLGDRSYDIHIEAGKINCFGAELASLNSVENMIVIADDIVAPLYLETVVAQCRITANRVDSIIVPAGESTKCVAQCDVLWQRLIELGTDRKTVIVALGGGVIGDLAGFIAASFTRGLDFVQIPTTLLAQVDSSVGGKVGINLPQAKNMVGAFWQPKSVIIDPLVLNTLDNRNYAAGMAEVIKYGVIMDAPFFEFLEQSISAVQERDPETLTKMIAWCCRCKADVVAEDETETTGRRAILNYGHTFGHAIESVFGYGKFLHGEAISIGMTCAARLAIAMGLCNPELLTRQTKLFQSLDLPTACPVERHDELLAAMKHDKKVAGGKLKLILPTQIGQVEIVSAPADDAILQSLLDS